ncbi:hypothetical protein Dimus_002720 [Dionaea muscipula]
MHDGVKTRLNRYSGAHNTKNPVETQSSTPFVQMGYPLGGKKKRGKGKKKLKGEAIMLDNPTLTQVHRYVIFNCGDEEIEKYITCVEFDVVKDEFGLTCVNFIKLCYMDDPFVLASQVHQVFYVQDPSKEECHYVLQNVPKDLVDLDKSLVASEESYWAEASNVGVDVMTPIGDDDVTWCRNDVALEMSFSVGDLDRQEIEDDSE